MSASISEFERTKPTKTFQAFGELLAKYQKLSELDSEMDAKEVAADLEGLFEVFKTGE
tara:strand:+ start:149 stop:322 length:174 start_codon:yes stop_codon:yes gene_type:complete